MFLAELFLVLSLHLTTDALQCSRYRGHLIMNVVMNNKCYYAWFRKRATYNEAVQLCKKGGTHVLFTETKEEHHRLVSRLGPGFTRLWIGLERNGSEWRWQGGQRSRPVGKMLFADKRAATVGHNAIVRKSGGKYIWQVQDPNKTFQVVCEQELGEESADSETDMSLSDERYTTTDMPHPPEEATQESTPAREFSLEIVSVGLSVTTVPIPSTSASTTIHTGPYSGTEPLPPVDGLTTSPIPSQINSARQTIVRDWTSSLGVAEHNNLLSSLIHSTTNARQNNIDKSVTITFATSLLGPSLITITDAVNKLKSVVSSFASMSALHEITSKSVLEASSIPEQSSVVESGPFLPLAPGQSSLTRSPAPGTIGSAASGVIGLSASGVIGPSASGVIGPSASGVIEPSASGVIGPSASGGVIWSSATIVLGSSASVGLAAPGVIGSFASVIGPTASSVIGSSTSGMIRSSASEVIASSASGVTGSFASAEIGFSASGETRFSASAEIGSSASGEIESSAAGETESSAAGEAMFSASAEIESSASGETGFSASAEIGSSALREIGSSASREIGSSASGEIESSASGETRFSASGEIESSASRDIRSSASGEIESSASGEIGFSALGETWFSASSEIESSASGETGLSASGGIGSSVSGEIGSSASGEIGSSASGEIGSSYSGPVFSQFVSGATLEESTNASRIEPSLSSTSHAAAAFTRNTSHSVTPFAVLIQRPFNSSSSSSKLVSLSVDMPTSSTQESASVATTGSPEPVQVPMVLPSSKQESVSVATTGLPEPVPVPVATPTSKQESVSVATTGLPEPVPVPMATPTFKQESVSVAITGLSEPVQIPMATPTSKHGSVSVATTASVDNWTEILKSTGPVLDTLSLTGPFMTISVTVATTSSVVVATSAVVLDGLVVLPKDISTSTVSTPRDKGRVQNKVPETLEAGYRVVYSVSDETNNIETFAFRKVTNIADVTMTTMFPATTNINCARVCAGGQYECDIVVFKDRVCKLYYL